MTAFKVTSQNVEALQGSSADPALRVTGQAIEALQGSDVIPALRVTSQNVEALKGLPVIPKLRVTGQVVEVIYTVGPPKPDLGIENEIDKYLQAQDDRFFPFKDTTIDDIIEDNTTPPEDTTSTGTDRYIQNQFEISGSTYVPIMTTTYTANSQSSVSGTIAFTMHGSHLSTSADYDYILAGEYWKNNTTSAAPVFYIELSDPTTGTVLYNSLQYASIVVGAGDSTYHLRSFRIDSVVARTYTAKLKFKVSTISEPDMGLSEVTWEFT